MVHKNKSKATIETVDALKNEAAKLQSRIDTDRMALKSLCTKIADRERAEKLHRLIDVPDGVTVSCHASRKSLRGKTGTVRKLNRTRAVVDIEGDPWTFPFELLHTDAYAAELTTMLSRQGGAR